MKKITSILLATLMLVSVFASCGGNDETTTTETPTTEAPTTETPTTEAPTTETPTTEAPTTEAPTTEAPTTEIPTTEAPTAIDPNAPWSSKNDKRDTWSGKTLNVACSTWYSEGAPWAMPEVFITEEDDASFGKEIQEAVLDRNEFIESTYGVKVNWINATKANMPSVLEAATLAENVNYDLAAPRMMNAQSIVAGGYVYDLADREFIDFRNPYYKDESVKTYTAHGHTFFVTGEFSTLDIETSSVLFFNKDLLTKEATNDIYDMVRKGEWTFDKLFAYSEAAYSDNGDGIRGNDTYGTAILMFFRYYDYFGVKSAGVNEATGQWELTIKDDRTDDAINAILKTRNHDYEAFITYNSWNFFNNNQVTFVVEDLLNLDELKIENIGIVPFPMHDKEQERYYVPCNMQMAIAMCIPKITQDRAMSEYFMDVLSWTGEDYVVKTYIDEKMERFRTEAEREMLMEYIIPSISYDVGAAVGWVSLISDIRSSDVYENNENHFDEVYAKAEPDALKTIAEWNAAWGGYTEE